MRAAPGGAARDWGREGSLEAGEEGQQLAAAAGRRAAQRGAGTRNRAERQTAPTTVGPAANLSRAELQHRPQLRGAAERIGDGLAGLQRGHREDAALDLSAQ